MKVPTKEERDLCVCVCVSVSNGRASIRSRKVCETVKVLNLWHISWLAGITNAFNGQMWVNDDGVPSSSLFDLSHRLSFFGYFLLFSISFSVVSSVDSLFYFLSLSLSFFLSFFFVSHRVFRTRQPTLRRRLRVLHAHQLSRHAGSRSKVFGYFLVHFFWGVLFILFLLAYCSVIVVR